jgi:hypothetical protein
VPRRDCNISNYPSSHQSIMTHPEVRMNRGIDGDRRPLRHQLKLEKAMRNNSQRFRSTAATEQTPYHPHPAGSSRCPPWNTPRALGTRHRLDALRVDPSSSLGGETLVAGMICRGTLLQDLLRRVTTRELGGRTGLRGDRRARRRIGDGGIVQDVLRVESALYGTEGPGSDSRERESEAV